jgi:hypothetical protein
MNNTQSSAESDNDEPVLVENDESFDKFNMPLNAAHFRTHVNSKFPVWSFYHELGVTLQKRLRSGAISSKTLVCLLCLEDLRGSICNAHT